MKQILIALAMVCCFAMPVHGANPEELTAVGKTVGIRLQEDGVTITGFTEESEAAASGLQVGDRIVKINMAEIRSAADVKSLVASGGQFTVTVERDGKTAEYLLEPAEQDGAYMLGIKIRDSIAGIGTVTYYDSDTGEFGALGHGVCGTNGGKLLEMTEGEIVPSVVTAVEKGKRGYAGQLQGTFENETTIGTVEKNTSRGIFGTMAAGQELGTVCAVGEKADVSTGAATIRSNVDGDTVAEYDVEILKIYPTESERNMLLKVTDRELLNQTGGIVQGMSGSPIIQDGKLVGAVTHVLVNDPTRGYGIFIENMLDAAG